MSRLSKVSADTTSHIFFTNNEIIQDIFLVIRRLITRKVTHTHNLLADCEKVERHWHFILPTNQLLAWVLLFIAALPVAIYKNSKARRGQRSYHKCGFSLILVCLACVVFISSANWMTHSDFSFLTPCVDAAHTGDKHKRDSKTIPRARRFHVFTVIIDAIGEFAVWCSHWVPSAPNHMKICLSFGNLIYECVKTHDTNNIEMPGLLLLIMTGFDCCKRGERDGTIPMSKNSAKYMQRRTYWQREKK